MEGVVPKRRRSDSFQHQLERESRQRAAEAELTGNMRDGAPNDLRGDDRRNFVSPVIRLVRGAARVVRRTIRVADLAADGGALARVIGPLCVWCGLSGMPNEKPARPAYGGHTAQNVRLRSAGWSQP